MEAQLEGKGVPVQAIALYAGIDLFSADDGADKAVQMLKIRPFVEANLGQVFIFRVKVKRYAPKRLKRSLRFRNGITVGDAVVRQFNVGRARILRDDQKTAARPVLV